MGNLIKTGNVFKESYMENIDIIKETDNFIIYKENNTYFAKHKTLDMIFADSDDVDKVIDYALKLEEAATEITSSIESDSDLQVDIPIKEMTELKEENKILKQNEKEIKTQAIQEACNYARKWMKSQAYFDISMRDAINVVEDYIGILEAEIE